MHVPSYNLNQLKIRDSRDHIQLVQMFIYFMRIRDFKSTGSKFLKGIYPI